MGGGLYFSHEIDRNPAVSEAGTINACVTMVTLDESVRRFSITWLAEYVMEDEGLSSREDLNDLLMEAGFPLEANLFALTEIANDRIIQVVEDDENNNYIRFRPASKLAVRSLTKKIYYKTSSGGGEKCTICLEEFKDGARVVTLPCGHEFEEKCIVDWLRPITFVHCVVSSFHVKISEEI